jgi:hypothetical protein
MALGKLLDGELTPVADAVTGDLDYRLVESRELAAILRGAL